MRPATSQEQCGYPACGLWSPVQDVSDTKFLRIKHSAATERIIRFKKVVDHDHESISIVELLHNTSRTGFLATLWVRQFVIRPNALQRRNLFG
jgi:hypothetical protein